MQKVKRCIGFHRPLNVTPTSTNFLGFRLSRVSFLSPKIQSTPPWLCTNGWLLRVRGHRCPRYPAIHKGGSNLSTGLVLAFHQEGGMPPSFEHVPHGRLRGHKSHPCHSKFSRVVLLHEAGLDPLENFHFVWCRLCARTMGRILNPRHWQFDAKFHNQHVLQQNRWV